MNKNILFVIDHMGSGGAQRVIAVLSDKLIKLGYNVDILIIDGGENETVYNLNDKINLYYLKHIINKYDVSKLQRIVRFKYYFKKRIYKNQKDRINYELNKSLRAQYVFKFLQEKNYKIIFSFLIDSNILLGLIAKKTKSKVVLTQRNFPAFSKYSDDFIKFRNHVYSNGDVLVFQTKEQMEYFPKKIKNKSVIIKNPIKSDLPLPYSGERKKIIVNFCRLNLTKNLPLLFEAFKIVVLKYPEYKLEIYGHGNQKEFLENKIKELELSDSVAILDFDPNIHEKIIDYSMFVMSSDYEGMPNSLIEAMGIGLPVISTDCDGGGAKALIENSKNGLLVPKYDKNALADAMIFYIENPEIADKYSKEALKIKEDLFVDKITQKWIDLI